MKTKEEQGKVIIVTEQSNDSALVATSSTRHQAEEIAQKHSFDACGHLHFYAASWVVDAMEEHASLVSEEKDRRIRELEEEIESLTTEKQVATTGLQFQIEEVDNLKDILGDVLSHYHTFGGLTDFNEDRINKALNSPKP